LSPQPVKIRADFEVTCFEVEGVEGIRAALLAGESLTTPDISIKVNLIAPPTYVISTNTLKKTEAFEMIAKSLDKIKETIESKKGKFKLIAQARIIGEKHDRELEMKLKELERQNDDQDEDDEEVEGMGIDNEIDREIDELQAKAQMEKSNK